MRTEGRPLDEFEIFAVLEVGAFVSSQTRRTHE